MQSDGDDEYEDEDDASVSGDDGEYDASPVKAKRVSIFVYYGEPRLTCYGF